MAIRFPITPGKFPISTLPVFAKGCVRRIKPIKTGHKAKGCVRRLKPIKTGHKRKAKKWIKSMRIKPEVKYRRLCGEFTLLI